MKFSSSNKAKKGRITLTPKTSRSAQMKSKKIINVNLNLLLVGKKETSSKNPLIIENLKKKQF